MPYLAHRDVLEDRRHAAVIHVDARVVRDELEPDALAGKDHPPLVVGRDGCRVKVDRVVHRGDERHRLLLVDSGELLQERGVGLVRLRHRHPVGRTVPQREVDAIALAHVNHRARHAAAERPRLEAHVGCDLDFLPDDVEPDVVRPVAGLQLGDEGQVGHGLALDQRSGHVWRVEYLRSRRTPDLVSGGCPARSNRERDCGDGGKRQGDGRQGQTTVLRTHLCFSTPTRHIHAAARETTRVNEVTRAAGGRRCASASSGEGD